MAGDPMFTVETVLERTRCELVVGGEVDLDTSRRLSAVGLQQLTRADVGAIVVDLADVEFMDSAGLGALVEIRNAARRVYKDFALRSPSPPVKRVLHLTGLDTVLTIQSH